MRGKILRCCACQQTCRSLKDASQFVGPSCFRLVGVRRNGRWRKLVAQTWVCAIAPDPFREGRFRSHHRQQQDQEARRGIGKIAPCWWGSSVTRTTALTQCRPRCNCSSTKAPSTFSIAAIWAAAGHRSVQGTGRWICLGRSGPRPHGAAALRGLAADPMLWCAR